MKASQVPLATQPPKGNRKMSQSLNARSFPQFSPRLTAGEYTFYNIPYLRTIVQHCRGGSKGFLLSEYKRELKHR